MTQSLATLIRLGKWVVDERRRALAALHEREDQTLATIDRMDAELAAEQAVAAEDSTGAGFGFGGFYDRHLQRREALIEQLEALRRDIEAAQADLAEAYRGLKTYEIAERQRLARDREEAERKERITLDEIGLNLNRRRRQRQGEG